MRLRYTCFSVSFARFLRKPTLYKICKSLLLRQDLGHNSFLKIVHEYMTDFLNKNAETIWIIRNATLCPLKGPIDTPEKMFLWRKNNIKGVQLL